MHYRQMRVVCATTTSCIHPSLPLPPCMYTQDKILVESRFCPREGCRAPMETRVHRGLQRRQCSKQKCKCITPRYVSAYIPTKGLALHCSRPFTYAAYIYIAVVTPLIAHHPIDSLHVYHTVIVISRGGDKRSADRTYAYIMHCFAWGTATPCIPVHHLSA